MKLYFVGIQESLVFLYIKVIFVSEYKKALYSFTITIVIARSQDGKLTVIMLQCKLLGKFLAKSCSRLSAVPTDDASPAQTGSRLTAAQQTTCRLWSRRQSTAEQATVDCVSLPANDVFRWRNPLWDSCPSGPLRQRRKSFSRT